jgi:hypothetical protein
MKKLINLTLIAMACLAVACHKDATLTKLQPVAFTGALTSTTTSVDITPADTASNVITFNWPAVVYPYKSHVTYTLQVDLPTDTIGTSPWANAQSVTIGSDVLTKTYKGGDFNTLAIAVGIGANDTGKLVVRVQAYQDRDAYSKPITISVITYKPTVVVPPFNAGYPILYLPGDYQGWLPNAIVPSSFGTAAAPTVGVYPISTAPNIYEGYIYEPAGGTYQFKFTNAPDWNHITYGDSGTPGLLSPTSTTNLTLPGAGLYEVSANPVTLAWAYTLTTWAIIGDATPNGWNTETEMTFVPSKMAYTIKLSMITAGSFKFRANNAWNIDFGIDNGTGGTNRIFYADNPVFGGPGSKPGLNNMTVPADGTYVVTLYLGDPNNYYYTAVKQ